MSAPLSSLSPSSELRQAAAAARQSLDSQPMASSKAPSSTGMPKSVRATRVDATMLTVDECPDAEMKPMMKEHHHHHHGNRNVGWAWGFIAFIILILIIWVILWIWCPEFVQQTCYDKKPNGKIDNGKALLWAIVIAIIIAVLISIFWWTTF